VTGWKAKRMLCQVGLFDFNVLKIQWFKVSAQARSHGGKGVGLALVWMKADEMACKCPMMLWVTAKKTGSWRKTRLCPTNTALNLHPSDLDKTTGKRSRHKKPNDPSPLCETYRPNIPKLTSRLM